MIYLYDGSFDGFLCCVYAHYYCGSASAIYAVDGFQQQLGETCAVVERDDEKAKKVYEAMEEKLGDEIVSKAYRCFLAEDLEKDTRILNYLRLCFRYGPQVDGYRTHPWILPIHELDKKVSGQVHRYLGILRFSDIQGVLYAAYTPDYDMTRILMPHFADRFKREQFIIHDRRRQKAGVYARGQWLERDFDVDLLQYRSEKERNLEALWKGYFEHIAIDARKNPKLQAHFVPKRYRSFVTEFQPR